MELTNQEMLKISGGSWYVIAGIGAALTYIIGVLSGLTNPSRCNNQKGGYMQARELNENEMLKINGGALTSSFINAINSVINTLFELGKETGSTLRRLIQGNYCPMN